MAGCSLMKGAWEVRLIPNRQLVRHSRRLSSFDKVLHEQDGKQLRIRHWDWVKLHLLSRLLLMLAFGPLLELRPLWLGLERCDLLSTLLSFVCTSVVGASRLWKRTVGPLCETGWPFYGKEKFVRLGIETMKCMMMDYAYAKMDTFFEGLVNVIVNTIRNIVSFDNLKCWKQFP
jgi:hypothetical protein